MNADIIVPVETPGAVRLGLIDLLASAVGMLSLGPIEVADQACQGRADKQGNHWLREVTATGLNLVTVSESDGQRLLLVLDGVPCPEAMVAYGT